MSLFELYRDDILTRFPGQTFTETVVGGLTRVELKGSDLIDSVTNSSSVARFHYLDANVVLEVGMQLTIVGFVTNTTYNGTFNITDTDGLTYFEIASIAWVENETGGSFSALVDSQFKIDKLDCYKNIRENIVGTVAETMFRLTTALKEALTDPPELTQVWDSGTNDIECFYNGAWQVVGATEWVIRPTSFVYTTDNTPTTIDSLTLGDGEAALVRVDVGGVQPNGNNRGAFIVAATAFREGTSASIQGVKTTLHEDQSDSPNWSVDFSASGTGINVVVTGNNSRNINWKCVFRYLIVTSA